MEIKMVGRQVVAPREVYDLIEKQRQLEEQMKENEQQLNDFKDALLRAMEQNGIKKWENDLISVTYVPASLRKTVDTAKLKEEGLYDQFTKESPVNASVRLKFKEKKCDLPF